MRDPYDILGVGKTAPQEEIKKAYRRLAKEYHPDLHPDDKIVEQKFKEVTAAYDLLSDPDKRARYDRGELDAEGNERMRPGAGWGGGGAGRRRSSPFGFDTGEFSAEDIFADLFGRGPRRGGAAGGGGGMRMRGGDVSYTMKVSFLEAAQGARKRITLTNGKSVDLNVPPGTEDHQTLRLKGQGMPGINGGPAGDAYVEIHVTPHPHFNREGNDIHVEVPVTLKEAVLGAKITVPTLSGNVVVSVPANSNNGATLRLKGKGVAPPGKAAGDQYVKLRLTLPERPDPDLTRFMEKWKTADGDSVRRNAGML